MMVLQLQSQLLIYVLASVLACGAFADQAVILNAQTDSHATCLKLTSTLPDLVSFPGSSTYELQTSRYWSNFQSSQMPTCRFTPTSAADVSITIKLIATSDTKIAIKSGGHAAFANASNIDDGITIDLVDLNSIHVAEDLQSVTIGAGLRWGEVYKTLGLQGIAVLGGRVADVGVGGVTTGGGLSFFSSLYGFVCDGVINFEVVLVNGSIVNANETSNHDLWWALKGGGANNFGIITSMKVKAFPLGTMWGGMKMFMLDDVKHTVYTTYEKFSHDLEKDPKASTILSFISLRDVGDVVVNLFEYAEPVAEPSIYKGFGALTPALSDSMRLTTLEDLTIELGNSNPTGDRELFSASSFQTSATLLSSIVNSFFAEMRPITQSTEGIWPCLIVQPLSKPMIAAAKFSGGNTMGIDDEDAPLMLVSLALRWQSAKDDEVLKNVASRFHKKIASDGKEAGLFHRYIYMNYASPILGQDVFKGYGSESKERLLRVREEFDPQHLLHKLAPGYFKL